MWIDIDLRAFRTETAPLHLRRLLKSTGSVGAPQAPAMAEQVDGFDGAPCPGPPGRDSQGAPCKTPLITAADLRDMFSGENSLGKTVHLMHQMLVDGVCNHKKAVLQAARGDAGCWVQG